MKSMLLSIPRLVLGLALASIFEAASAQGQSLAPNQTQGFYNGKLVKLTYQENFDCVDKALDDLDYNHMPARSDSGEMQTPICQAGIQPTVDPTGENAKHAAILYVLVPTFSVNDDQNPDDAIPCPRKSG